jgi:hypothetical protein
VVVDAVPLAEAADWTRTGDVWVFRGRTLADVAIHMGTNSPVNHVGMTLTVDDLPPLLWHAELGHSLTDVWSGKRRRGAQLHVLTDAVRRWVHGYGQLAWVRQLHPEATRAMEDAALRTVARLDGTPFPSTAALATGFVLSRVRSRRPVEAADAETAFCAEVVAAAYQEMGLLPADRRADSYDPGRFWSGDGLELLGGATLGGEIAVVDVAADGGAADGALGEGGR